MILSKRKQSPRKLYRYSGNFRFLNNVDNYFIIKSKKNKKKKYNYNKQTNNPYKSARLLDFSF